MVCDNDFDATTSSEQGTEREDKLFMMETKNEMPDQNKAREYLEVLDSTNPLPDGLLIQAENVETESKSEYDGSVKIFDYTDSTVAHDNHASQPVSLETNPPPEVLPNQAVFRETESESGSSLSQGPYKGCVDIFYYSNSENQAVSLETNPSADGD